MKSFGTPLFWQLHRALPEPIRLQARKVYRLWRENPAHPSLHFKKLKGSGNRYSIRVTLDYRAICEVESDLVKWVWIGTHAEYNRLV